MTLTWSGEPGQQTAQARVMTQCVCAVLPAQVLLESMFEAKSKVHKEYIRFRNAACE